jgi:hypothetical protein
VVFVDAVRNGCFKRLVTIVGLKARRRKLDTKCLNQVALLAQILSQLAQRKVVSHALARSGLKSEEVVSASEWFQTQALVPKEVSDWMTKTHLQVSKLDVPLTA